MAAVPETTLNWLYSVLTSNYTDVNRTYHDAAEALSHYPSLAVHTEVYTYENGTSSLLVRLRGTLPVTFRGATYGFPVAVWLPYAYPREPPIVYVQPEKDMLVRPGQHVSGDGRVYHPYLAQWARYWDKSTVYDFLAVLRGVFAKEPPVRSRVQVRAPQQVPQQQVPPPVPPPPVELRRDYATPSPAREPVSAPKPPPKPPKPHEQEQGRYSQPPLPPKPHEQQNRYSQPPPLPPQQTNYTAPPPPHWQHQQQGPPPRPHVQPQVFQPNQYGVGSPVSPLTPQDQRAAPRHAPPPMMPQYQAQHQQQQQPPPPQQPQYHPQQHPPQHQQQYARPQPPPQPQQAPAPPPNLLDDTLTTTTAPPAAPPIPPNPEKDALLSLLSTSLVTHIRSTVSTNTSALTALLAQQSALQSAHARLQAELAELRALDAALESNTQLLGSAMRDADAGIAAAQHRQPPDVDDVLVAPTVVGGQLYAVAAEERAIADAVFVLGRALDRGRIGVDVFVKQSRVLARESFLKKALLRKIARGMGIDEVGMR